MRGEEPVRGALTLAQAFAQHRAGRDYLAARRVLQDAGLNLVGEALRGQSRFVESEHYPADDVYDAETGSQYYYHAHRGIPGEHGHFHAFVRTGRLALGGDTRHGTGEPRGRDAIAHLVAISMDAWGWPMGLFVTNRWVTGETWYPAAEVARWLRCFDVGHAWPSLPLNQAIGALLRLYRPRIVALLQQRDAVVRRAQRGARRRNQVLEDRDLDVLAAVRIDVLADIAAIDAALRGAGTLSPAAPGCAPPQGARPRRARAPSARAPRASAPASSP